MITYIGQERKFIQQRKHADYFVLIYEGQIGIGEKRIDSEAQEFSTDQKFVHLLSKQEKGHIKSLTV